jgi:hypothetical protein
MEEKNAGEIWLMFLSEKEFLQIRTLALEYGVLGILRIWAHLALMKESARHPIEALCYAFLLEDSVIARSAMESLPHDCVPPPSLWKYDSMEMLDLRTFLVVCRVCYQHATEILQPGPDGKTLYIDGREMAKKFPWKEVFPAADIPDSE